MSSWIAALRTKPSGSISITVTMAAPKTVRTGSVPPTCASSWATLSSCSDTILHSSVRYHSQKAGRAGAGRWGHVAQRDLLSMALDNRARRVTQFVDVGSADAEARQEIRVDCEDRQGFSQRHVVEFEPHCAGHYLTLRRSSPARRALRA